MKLLTLFNLIDSRKSDSIETGHSKLDNYFSSKKFKKPKKVVPSVKKSTYGIPVGLNSNASSGESGGDGGGGGE
jgi:hypothetical protein